VALKVLRAGILSSLQDLGRWGSQRTGVPVGGAMDEYSHRLANLLVGNEEGEATIEMTLVGPGFAVTQDTLFAVCGADFEARANGELLPKARPIWIQAGSTLDFGPCRKGCRAYLAVAGGFDVAPVLGSRSTYIRGGFGGWRGRALQRGDLLPLRIPPRSIYPSLRRKLTGSSARMSYPGWSATEQLEAEGAMMQRVRFMRGRHWLHFRDEARARFMTAEYRVATNSDRQGYRLRGAVLDLAQPLEIISGAMTFGTIQVPPDGEPIVLMANHQTTGGYPRLGEVISADLPVLAQLPPGASGRMEAVELVQAHAARMARERDMALIREAIALHAED
jgi:antagonist of KipI